MKIKEKENLIFNIKLKHDELVIIKKALDKYLNLTDAELEILNGELFDCDEFKNKTELQLKLLKMVNKIEKAVKDIYVY